MNTLFRGATAVLAILLVAGMMASPGLAQDIEYKDNGTTVQTTEIGNTTYRTTITADGTVYRSTRTQIGNSTYHQGSSSDGWTYSGSSYEIGSTSYSNTDYYDASGAFTGSSSTTTFDSGIGTTTTYEGFDGIDYDTEIITNYDSDY